jgi:hypothetical protein
MQQICDGLQSKRDVLHFMIEQYKEVYLKARREFQTVENVSSMLLFITPKLIRQAVMDYLHGQGEAQDALRAAARGRARGAARGARGRGAGAARGRNPRNDTNNDDDDDDGGPAGGGGRGAARGRGRGASSRGTTRGGRGAARNSRGNGDGKLIIGLAGIELTRRRPWRRYSPMFMRNGRGRAHCRSNLKECWAIFSYLPKTPRAAVRLLRELLSTYSC